MFQTLKRTYNKCKMAVKSICTTVAVAIAAGTALVTSSVITAQAALTTDQQAVITAIDTLYDDVTTFAWGFVLTATGLWIGISLFRKGVFKAVK